MKTTFNLNTFRKQAFYEDDRGYWVKQERACQNCYKKKVDEGLQPQQAWGNCLEEYQNTEDKAKWSLSYSATVDKGPKPYFDAKTPAAQKLTKQQQDFFDCSQNHYLSCV